MRLRNPKIDKAIYRAIDSSPAPLNKSAIEKLVPYARMTVRAHLPTVLKHYPVLSEDGKFVSVRNFYASRLLNVEGEKNNLDRIRFQLKRLAYLERVNESRVLRTLAAKRTL